MQSSNYSFQFLNGTLSVGKASLTLTAENKSRNYGQNNPPLTVSYSGFVNGETLTTSDLSGTPVLFTAATEGSDVGVYPITLAAGTLRSANYTLAFADGTLSIAATGCAPGGVLTVSDACYGTNIQLTYTNTSATGPFTLVINDSVYKNILSGIPFATGTLSVNAPESIWPGTSMPVSGNVVNNEAAEVGVKFRPNVPGEISGIRFYKVAGNTGTHTGSLWSSDGTLLATATFTSETSAGWQQVYFDQPVIVTPGTTYIASYYAPNGNYAYAPNTFTGKRVTNATGSLTALKASDGGNGVLRKGSAGYPNEQTTDNGNFFVDVVFNNTTSVSRFALTGVVAADGCASNALPIASVEAKMGAFFDMSVSKQDLECLENSNGSITVNAFGCNTPFTFSINNGNYQSGNTFSNLKAGTYTLRIKDGTNLVRDTAITIGVETAVWTGALNNDWHNAANWSINKVPGVATHVIIGASTNECVISNSDVSVASIQIRPGGLMRSVNDRKVNVTGTCVVLPVQ